MTIQPFKLDDRYTTRALVRRLLLEHGTAHWRLYACAFALMAIAAASTAIVAYLMGDFINYAYLSKNFKGITAIGIICLVVFTVRGLALYGQAVLMSRIGNRISAGNQKRVFDKLLNESLS
ncbi:MAG: ATP-binding cassette, subfamily bacterial MsbA, partial [Hyphomicrobiales bacterium]|nr:ATP-binding cassette, subfamily bacterial MsbA [Hyphomicrobiales bacterium]